MARQKMLCNVQANAQIVQLISAPTKVGYAFCNPKVDVPSVVREMMDTLDGWIGARRTHLSSFTASISDLPRVEA
jgi:hypothetical protein